jgi:hypothetical protein
MIVEYIRHTIAGEAAQDFEGAYAAAAGGTRGRLPEQSGAPTTVTAGRV